MAAPASFEDARLDGDAASTCDLALQRKLIVFQHQLISQAKINEITHEKLVEQDEQIQELQARLGDTAAVAAAALQKVEEVKAALEPAPAGGNATARAARAGPSRRSAARASTSRTGRRQGATLSAQGAGVQRPREQGRHSFAKMRLMKFNEQGGREALDEVIELGALQREHLPYVALVAVDFSGMKPEGRHAMKAEEPTLSPQARAHYTAHCDCLPTHQPSGRPMQPKSFRAFLEARFTSEAVQSALRDVEEELVAHGEALPVRAAQQAGPEAPATGGEA